MYDGIAASSESPSRSEGRMMRLPACTAETSDRSRAYGGLATSEDAHDTYPARVSPDSVDGSVPEIMFELKSSDDSPEGGMNDDGMVPQKRLFRRSATYKLGSAVNTVQSFVTNELDAKPRTLVTHANPH